MDAPFPAGIVEAWDQFLAEDREPFGANVYPKIFEHPMLFPLQRMRETEAMIAMAREINPTVVMEIGSDKGGSFYHWVKAFSPDIAIALEIRGVPFADAFRRTFKQTDFLMIHGSSYAGETVDEVRRYLDGTMIDCLFIDGDKKGFGRDVMSYLPLVRPGGLIFLHDVQDVAEAKHALAAWASTGRKTEILLDTSEYDEIEKRIVEDLPVATSYEGWFRIWQRTSCGVGVIHV